MKTMYHVSDSAFYDWYKNNTRKPDVTHVIVEEEKNGYYIGGDYKCARFDTAVRRILKAVECDERFDGIRETLAEMITPARHYGKIRIGDNHVQWMAYDIPGSGKYHIYITVEAEERKGA